jgi:hypothetical protein
LTKHADIDIDQRQPGCQGGLFRTSWGLIRSR